MVLAALLVTACPGCTNEPEERHPVLTTGPSSDTPSSAAAVSSAAAPTAGPTLPPTTPGELTRAILSREKEETTFRRPARGGTEYGLQAVCTSKTPDRTLTYEVRATDTSGPHRFIAGGTLSCDATVMLNGLGTSLPPEPIHVEFDMGAAGLTDITFGYAVIAPMTELHQ